MTMVKKMTAKVWLLLILAVASVYSVPSMALSCRYGANSSSGNATGPITQNFPIGLVYLSQSDFTKGTFLWRSQTYTAVFTCWDINSYKKGEDAYIYWDPQSDLSAVDPSLKVGVTINGHDYDDIHGMSRTRGPDVGVGTLTNNGNTALPQTVTVEFSLYIKSSGLKPPASYIDIGNTRVFQVDGELGLNATPNSNYNANLTNFNNINVLQCTPTVNIQGTSQNTIDFGSIMKETSAVNKIAREVPFTVTSDVSGGGCKGQQLAISFSSNDVSPNDSTLLIPNTKPGVGINISESGNETPITFGKVYSFSDTALSGDVTTITKNYKASLKWLTTSPTVGPFSTTAVVSITFK